MQLLDRLDESGLLGGRYAAFIFTRPDFYWLCDHPPVSSLGAAHIMVQSDGNAVKLAENGYAEHVHRFEKPGDYVVKVQRTNEFGVIATGHLWVHVAPNSNQK